MPDNETQTSINDKRSANVFDNYKKTCSTVFGKASQSQLRYIQALSDLQQAMWTSCESLVAKQIAAIEEYSKTDGDSSHIEPLLQIYTTMIDESMKWVSTSYDAGVVRLQIYRNSIERFSDLIPQPPATGSKTK